jgi:hypothetical protein
MRAYRSVGIAAALAALCACASSGPPHPANWTQSGKYQWSSMSGAGPERYVYSANPTQGSLTDLASSMAVDTAVRYRGARLVHSLPFSSCPAEAGLATYTLPGRRILEVGFSVDNGQAIVVRYERPTGVAESKEVLAAFRQALCYLP